MQSSISKILVILILLGVVCAAGLAWYVLDLHASPTNLQTPQGNNLPAVPASGGGQQQTQAQTSANIGQTYGTLFQTLGAQSVAFTVVSASSGGSAADIYALYSNDIAVSKKLNPPVTSFPLPVAFVNLNSGGVSGAFVYENFPSFCGSAGCPLTLYIQKNGIWTNVLDTLGGKDVGISNNTTNGYADIFISVAGETNSQTNVVRYAWDGTQYQPKETVATWDGTTFNLAH
ncbi:MAG TPA: hypothetical protein VMR46_03165 [Candidatus Paceibacterota bacterium]|nr:hypothetical protein [Candidatus Paceibacterota bacterium]